MRPPPPAWPRCGAPRPPPAAAIQRVGPPPAAPPPPPAPPPPAPPLCRASADTLSRASGCRSTESLPSLVATSTCRKLSAYTASEPAAAAQHALDVRGQLTGTTPGDR